MTATIMFILKKKVCAGITSKAARSRVVNIKHVRYLRFEFSDALSQSGAVK